MYHAIDAFQYVLGYSSNVTEILRVSTGFRQPRRSGETMRKVARIIPDERGPRMKFPKSMEDHWPDISHVPRDQYLHEHSITVSGPQFARRHTRKTGASR